MEGFGVPGFLLWPAILLEILLPILIIIGYKTQISAIFLALFCILTGLIFHLDFANQMQVIALLKNFGLAGVLCLLQLMELETGQWTGKKNTLDYNFLKKLL